MKSILLTLILFWTAAQEAHTTVPCGRAEDKERPEDKVACECYTQKDPCAEGEEPSCGAYCNKKLCTCCQL